MTTLRRRMLEDLQLRGLAPKTQQCYVAAVRQLAHYYRRPPDQLNDEELRQYFLYLRNEKKVAESTFRIHLYGIRFFYERTLTRPEPPKTARRVESAGSAGPPGLGQEPDSPDVSATDLRLWAAPHGGHAAAGLRH